MSDFTPYRPTDEEYAHIASFLPFICVDILPAKRDESGQWNVGLIVRATGSQAGKLTVLGGRILHSETAETALLRHLRTDLQVGAFEYFPGLSEERPFMVQQYFQADKPSDNNYGFDPTKHALALTYLVMIDEHEIAPVKEASGFEWLSSVEGRDFGFNQQVVASKALQFLNSQ